MSLRDFFFGKKPSGREEVIALLSSAINKISGARHTAPITQARVLASQAMAVYKKKDRIREVVSEQPQLNLEVQVLLSLIEIAIKKTPRNAAYTDDEAANFNKQNIPLPVRLASLKDKLERIH